MLDRTIPYKNIFMRCDRVPDTAPVLPDGYAFRRYDTSGAAAWAALEYAVGDFKSETEAASYFRGRYGAAPDKLEKRCVLIADAGGAVVASCIAWWDEMDGVRVPSLHWLVTRPDRQGLGLGKAVLLRTLQVFAGLGEYPVYLHTQPWSYRAVLMYSKCGFRLLKSAAFTGYVNEYTEAVEAMRPHIGDAHCRRLTEQAE